ncbi:serine/threonine protein kinase [Kibdelosporangium philippinense]|uniref:non-specific serine/threonine protein kinase n=1 Tax=Kibdelosporangium philippinense TaxID=211113 RepID=A0ABS8ZSW3_9PSEU|nr:serine/threonine-protein kinase [Kibdelosporangium philippinense]MCE7010791.1 serine/threonine protein kinase [Kibdelosporangium philippinense]
MHRVVGDRYELVRPLGRGGMGEVWLGRDYRLDRDVAVKLLRPNTLPAGADVEALIQRFNREARLTAKLENSGVPAVYDTGKDEDDLYLVMQLIPGADLSDFQAENEPVPVSWVAAIGAQIASVLAAAHAVGLVHRDLKPRNVMITDTGEVKVLDFGIAVLRDVDMTRITRTAETVGTPAYMAPEQAMHGQTSPSSDLYSLGCVLYELVTGQYVFDAHTALAMMHRHFNDTPEPVQSLRPDVDPRLADVIARLLAKQPDQRPASANEVYDVLLPMVSGPLNGSLIPMDPSRPFRDHLAAPRPPSGPVTPMDMPTVPVLPSFTAPAGTRVTPVPAAIRDSVPRRVGESFMLAVSVLLMLVYLQDAANGKPVPDAAFTFSLLGGLLAIALWMRKRRLQLRFPWSLAPFGKRVLGPRRSNLAEKILERTLFVIGGMLWAGFFGELIAGIVKGHPFMYIESPLLAAGICMVFFAPALLMRQRRLGKPYPWIW